MVEPDALTDVELQLLEAKLTRKNNWLCSCSLVGRVAIVRASYDLVCA